MTMTGEFQGVIAFSPDRNVRGDACLEEQNDGTSVAIVEDGRGAKERSASVAALDAHVSQEIMWDEV